MSKLEDFIDKLQGRVKFHRKEMKTEMINDIIAQRLGAVAELKWIIRELKKQASSHREEIEALERKAWECSGHKNEAVELLERVLQDLESGEYANGQVTFEEVSCFLIKVQDP